MMAAWDRQSGSASCFDPDLEMMDRGALDALVEERLLASIRIAYFESALVRAIWDRAGVPVDSMQSLEDFRHRAPFIDKDELRAYIRTSGDPTGAMLGAGVRHLVTMGAHPEQRAR